MRPNFRSVSGALLMLVIIPIFAGLLACMPEYVPLGNPERARIDEDMNGMWFVSGDGTEYGLIGHFVVLEPWDKRTWLITTVGIEESFSEDLEDYFYDLEDEYEYDTSTYEGLVRFFDNPLVDEEDFEASALQYKSWLVKLGGEQFMTWELRVITDDPDDFLMPWYWQDFRVTERTADRMVMHLIDPKFPPLEEAPAERRAWEKVVKKYADDEDLYYEEDIVFERVKEDDLPIFVGLLNYAVMGEAM